MLDFDENEMATVHITFLFNKTTHPYLTQDFHLEIAHFAHSS